MIRAVRLDGPGRHRLSARRRGRPRVRRLRRQLARARRDHRLRHRHLGGLSRRPPQAPRLLQVAIGATCDRPRPPHRPHREPAAGRSRGAVRQGARRAGDAGRSRRLPRPDADRDGPDEPRGRPRPADPPRLLAQPLRPRSSPRFGRDKGFDIPQPHRLRARAEAAARRGRNASPTSRSSSSRSTRPRSRASSRRSPASIPALQARARPGGSSTAPRACAASAS